MQWVYIVFTAADEPISVFSNESEAINWIESFRERAGYYVQEWNVI